MTDETFKAKVKELSTLISVVADAQMEKCRHKHHCHRIPQLLDAVDLCSELTREFDLRESEALVRANTLSSGHDDMSMQSTSTLDYDIELSDENCPKCGHEAYERRCECDDGLSYHDCGEDSCCCIDDSPNVRCDLCLGRGYHCWCRRCGWDLLEKRFLNGHDERTVAELEEDQARVA